MYCGSVDEEEEQEEEEDYDGCPLLSWTGGTTSLKTRKGP